MVSRSLLFLLVTAIVAACGGSPPVSSPVPSAPAGLEQTYEVTYNDGTTLVDAATYEAALVSAPDPSASPAASGESTGTYRLRSAEWVNALEPGQVVIFANHALVRITAVAQAGDEVVVTTTPAALNDAIKDGRVGWKYGVNWQNLPPASYREVARGLAESVTQPIARTQVGGVVPDVELAQITPGLNWSGSVQGFDVELSLTPTPDRLNLALAAKKKLPLGTTVAASAKGWISNFTQETFLTYEQSQGSNATSKTIGLQGEIEVEWHAAKLGEALTEITSFKVPVSLPIPFTVGPIPVVLKLMASLQVVPELSVEQASSGGNYKLKYQSDQGLEITGSSQTPFSDVKGVDIGVGTSAETVSAGFGVVGFALGVEFPRFEISVFGTTSAFITLKSYSSSQWTPGTTLTNDIPPCQLGTSSLAAYAGYAVSVLGIKLAESEPKELWKRDFTKYLNDKPCTLTGEPVP